MPPLSDAITTVDELKNRVLAFARARDWEQFHAPKNLSMALAAEAGELMEHFLWATPEQSNTPSWPATLGAFSIVSIETALRNWARELSAPFAWFFQAT